MNYQKDTFQPNSIVLVKRHLITPMFLAICFYVCVREKPDLTHYGLVSRLGSKVYLSRLAFLPSVYYYRVSSLLCSFLSKSWPENPSRRL